MDRKLACSGRLKPVLRPCLAPVCVVPCRPSVSQDFLIWQISPAPASSGHFHPTPLSILPHSSSSHSSSSSTHARPVPSAVSRSRSGGAAPPTPEPAEPSLAPAPTAPVQVRLAGDPHRAAARSRSNLSAAWLGLRNACWESLRHAGGSGGEANAPTTTVQGGMQDLLPHHPLLHSKTAASDGAGIG